MTTAVKITIINALVFHDACHYYNKTRDLVFSFLFFFLLSGMIEIIKAFILLLLSLFIVNTTAAEDQPQYAKTDPSQSFKFKEKYPPPLKIPKAKPEWLELIRHVNITSAPVYKNINYAGKKVQINILFNDLTLFF